jgi:ubiquitin C-terminal hydrolase
MHPVPELGFQSMAVHEDSIEDVRRVIGRKLDDDINQAGNLSVICPICYRINPSVTRQFCIEAAPEILRVALNISTTTTTGDPKKELNPVGYTQYLDLTEFQRDRGTPLRYRLSSVVHHQGQRYDRGHYVSTVQGYGPNIYYIDDDVVRPENTTFFTSNPQRDPMPASIPAQRVVEWQTQNRREAVILMYVRER